MAPPERSWPRPTPSPSSPRAGLVTYVYRDGSTTSITGTGTYAKSLPGQFDATPGGDLFLYNPGGGADGVLHVDWSGSSTSLSFTPMTVSGTFTPVVGDFDGNGVDDILWYAPGSAADYLWRFDAAGGHTTVRVSVGGTYKPIVIDANGDGRQDIVWYAPGAGADSIWLFKADASHTSKAVSIGGSYTPVVGEFGAVAAGAPPEGIVFFNPAGADYLWTFTSSAGHTSDPLPNVDGNYQLLPGQFLEETYGSLFYYGAGSLPEHLFAFGPGAGPDISEQEVPSISGAYTMTTARLRRQPAERPVPLVGHEHHPPLEVPVRRLDRLPGGHEHPAELLPRRRRHGHRLSSSTRTQRSRTRSERSHTGPRSPHLDTCPGSSE